MTKRLSAIIILSLLIVAFLAASVSAAVSKPNVWKYRIYKDKRTVLKMAGTEGVPFGIDAAKAPANLGYDEKASLSPGMTIGTSTYDIQSNSRMNRQVEWRTNAEASQMVHFIWTKSITDNAATRVTGYEAWDDIDAQLVFAGTGGGCDTHADAARSGYVSLDIDTENKANIGNHYDPTGTGDAYMATVFYDNLSASCFFGPYTRPIPDSVAKMAFSEAEITPGDWRLTWPQHEYQVLGVDTITHLIAHQSYADAAAHIGDPAKIIYFRRVGSDTVGYWEYPPMIVDTVTNISNSIASSRTTGKVDIVWSAPPGAYPGDPESNARNGDLDNGLGSVQRTCDIYYMESNNMGAPGSWGSKVNVTKYDSSQGGWLTTGEISPLIDPSDVLHVVWNAREAEPDPDGTALGQWTLYFGSRVFHWDDISGDVRVVTDRNWDITREEFNDSTCTGGAWNQMSCVKPTISYCDGKFYVVFVQFLDLFHGIHDDCALLRWQGAGFSGTANGELYLSVSDNNGRNWDLPRNLTQSYTPRCDTAAGGFECDADHWPSMPRFGMQVVDGNFTGVPVVDPSGSYSGSHYLDVFYVNDKFPGACMQDAGIWTVSPLKWFRVPCVDPVPTPVLAFTPVSIGPPTWTKPGVQLLDTARLENVGNAPLTVHSVAAVQTGGAKVDWLALSKTGPLSISEGDPNFDEVEIYLNWNGNETTGPHVYEGIIVMNSNSANEDSWDTIFVDLIIADTVMFPEDLDIRTDCKRIQFNNAGNIGNDGGPGGNGTYNLDFVGMELDCDTTDNTQGSNDHAGVYLFSSSPFLSHLKGTDTVLNYGMFDATWLNEKGFRPLTSPFADSTTYGAYQYGYSSEFLSKDSTIGMEVEVFAPKGASDCEFIVMKQRFYNLTQTPITGVYLGDFADWDIPSDSGSENGSDHDASRNLQYIFGGEYDLDTNEAGEIINDDCVLADQRMGGISYVGGFKTPYYTSSDSFPNYRAMWTEINADYVYPTGGFIPGDIYQDLQTRIGQDEWESTNPTMEDSLYQDLHQVVVFGQYDLTVGDTLVFCKIYATEYDGGLGGLQGTVDAAIEWIGQHPEVFSYPAYVVGRCCYGTDPIAPDCGDFTITECTATGTMVSWDPDLNCTDDPCPTGCCIEAKAGDADDNGALNILDVTFIINYLYKNGPAPPCVDQADADGNNSLNILDVTHIINYLYKNGPDPKCGTTGV